MQYGVLFNDKHSYTDYGMYMIKPPEIARPEPKVITVDIPGADGALDMTESVTGETKFYNREIKLSFRAMVDRDQRDAFCSELQNDIHGNICKVVFDTDPEWYWQGRASVEFDDIRSWRLNITITLDAEPYKLRTKETVVSFSVTSSDTESTLLGKSVPTSNTSTTSEIAFPDYADITIFDSLRFVSDSAESIILIDVCDLTGVYFGPYTVRKSSGKNYEIDIVELSYDGITLDKITSIVVVHELDVLLYGVMSSVVAFDLYNSRMSVVPTIVDPQSSHPLVVVNGVSATLADEVNIVPEIVLKSGKNKILVQNTSQISNPPIEFRYREGSL